MSGYMNTLDHLDHSDYRQDQRVKQNKLWRMVFICNLFINIPPLALLISYHFKPVNIINDTCTINTVNINEYQCIEGFNEYCWTLTTSFSTININGENTIQHNQTIECNNDFNCLSNYNTILVPDSEIDCCLINNKVNYTLTGCHKKREYNSLNSTTAIISAIGIFILFLLMSSCNSSIIYSSDYDELTVSTILYTNTIYIMFIGLCIYGAYALYTS